METKESHQIIEPLYTSKRIAGNNFKSLEPQMCWVRSFFEGKRLETAKTFLQLADYIKVNFPEESFITYDIDAGQVCGIYVSYHEYETEEEVLKRLDIQKKLNERNELEERQQLQVLLNKYGDSLNASKN